MQGSRVLLYNTVPIINNTVFHPYNFIFFYNFIKRVDLILNILPTIKFKNKNQKKKTFKMVIFKKSVF